MWTDDEDALLAQWQGRVGNKWSEVARHIPGKTGQQCAQRWRHRVNPNISREKWSEEEDAHLGTLVAKYGNSWAEIARRLPGRTGAWGGRGVGWRAAAVLLDRLAGWLAGWLAVECLRLTGKRRGGVSRWPACWRACLSILRFHFSGEGSRTEIPPPLGTDASKSR